MKNLIKILVLSFLFVFTFAAKPAKAFYLEVPQALKNLLTALSAQKSIAQTAPMMEQQQMPMMNYQQAPMPTTQYSQPTQTCNVDGKELPGSCEQYKQQGAQGMQGNYQGMPSGDQGQNMGPSPEQQARQLQDMKRGIKQTERPVKEFERMIQNAEKKGATISEEVRQNLAKMKAILEGAKNATTMEEMQNIDMAEMGDLMQSMDEFRRDVVEKQQRMEGMKRGMKGMEQGLKMFEKQIASLTKKGITVPADIKEHIAKLRTVIDKVKIAKSFDEVQEDMESMQDLMETFDQDRQQLEVLARWPQTLKQINQQLTGLTRELTRSKSIVSRLAKKGIDLQTQYTAFANAVNKLKSVRDDAVTKMAAGQSEEAFSALEDDFFGQMDDVWQYQRVIMTMSNLGRFTSEFKQGIAQANSMVRNLKRKKVDTSDMEALVAQSNDKGQEIINLLKAGNIDEETVISALEELENIKQEFEAKVDELTGQENEMPWEQGPQQFRRIEMSSEMQKFIPQRQEAIPQSMPEPMQAPNAELEVIQQTPV